MKYLLDIFHALKMLMWKFSNFLQKKILQKLFLTKKVFRNMYLYMYM